MIVRPRHDFFQLDLIKSKTSNQLSVDDWSQNDGSAHDSAWVRPPRKSRLYLVLKNIGIGAFAETDTEPKHNLTEPNRNRTETRIGRSLAFKLAC